MKSIYKIFIFFLMFQMSAIIISGLNIFPSVGLYSDLNYNDIQGKDAIQIISYFITPTGGYSQAGSYYPVFGIELILGIIGVAGVLIGFLTKDVSIAVVGLIAAIFVPMIAKSMGFFNRLFNQFDTPSLVYLGLAMGVGIAAIVIITLIETPTHGRSGE